MEVKISAVIITFNEEQNIRSCLEAVSDIADEIVVVDSYSTDRTEEICREYNTVFIKHKFTGHIQQKNWAILQTTYPHILSLDADEVLSEKLRASIQGVKENWTHDGYYFNRLTSYCGKWIRHTSWYPSRKLRLWDSRKGCWGGVNPHDRYILKQGAKRKFLRGDLLHYSYHSVNEHLGQINSFSSILAQSYYEQGRRSNLCQIVFRPLWRFMKDFIFLRGFMDGFYGYVVSVNSAHEVFLKYVKLRNIYREERFRKRAAICFFNTQGTWGGGEKWHLDMLSSLDRTEFRSIYISAPGSPLSQKVSKLNVSGYQIHISNLSFLNPFKIIRLARIFRKEKVGVLLTNLSNDMKVASIAAKITGVPKIIYRRGSAIPVKNSILNRYLFRKVLTGIMANSQETRRTILANNFSLVPEEKIKVIYNGVSLSRYQRDTKPLYESKEGEIVLGCAGRLSEEKGHLHLLEMMKQLKRNKVNCKLLIAGEGKMRHALERKASKLGVYEQVEFLGFVEEMPAFFSSIDIFLLSSRFEGFGYVIAEAMASWKPVVAFDIKSSVEIVEHGITGFITRPDRVDEMTSRVQELAEDKGLREKMGEMGRARVEEFFSFVKNQKEVVEYINPHS
jgi:glycosyltransferase involved in cell wall biosynthesis